MKNEKIPVFFTIDNNYAPYLAAALSSLSKNSSNEREYKITVIHESLSSENMKKIKKLQKENIEIEFAEMKKGLAMVVDKLGNRLRCDYFTLTIYFRLFIANMFPELDKAVYIDSDVVLLSDIAELYDIDIGENIIGAVRDTSVSEVSELVHYMEEAVGVRGEEYINSGVLLMNLKKMRELDLEGHFLSLFTSYSFDTIAPDQDYLNAICNGKIYYLPEVWDTMPREGAEDDPGAKLIHYNLFSKPWCYDGIQYGEYFWKYAESSGYYDRLREIKDGYSDEKKAEDARCLGLLIKRAAEIPENDVTFKKMKNGGVRIRL